MNLSQTPRFVGIDVGKFDLVLAFHGAQDHMTFANTPEGIAALTKCLCCSPDPVHIVLEATGGYEWAVWEALDAAGLAVRQVPPAQVRAFARSCGTRAKTDSIDAQVLAGFAAFRPDAGRKLNDESIRDLRALVTARRQRVAAKTRLLGQIERAAPAQVQALDRAMIDLVAQQIAELDAAIARALKADAALQGAAQLLRSIPGIGPVLAATLIVEMPELGSLRPKAAAALAGVAPMARDSGSWKGRRFIAGGRKTLRDVLFMAATVAARHNPDLSAFFKALKARGVPHKKAISAVARKLIILANTVLKRKTPWIQTKP